MKKVNVPNKYGLIEIDFDGHVKACFRVEKRCIVVVGAMNGYGEPIIIE